MLRRFIFLLFFVLITSSTFGDNDNLAGIKWVDNIPIFSKIDVKNKNIADFDSVHGKILIIPFKVKNSEEQNMKNFYNNFFLENGWTKSKINKNNLIWEKKEGILRSKKLIIKKSSINSWTLTIVVENF